MSDEATGSFSTFGEMLKHLRRRARLTQKELGIAVGYSEAHVARLENGQRIPDLATVQAVLVQALDLKNEPTLTAELLRLAKLARDGKPEPQREAAPGAANICPNNLPVQLSDFIGRAHEIQDVLHLLTTTRLLTLTGSGGAGKTRLSIEVGHEVVRTSSAFPDGVWLVELAPISDPDLIADTMITILDVPESITGTDAVVKQLRNARMLIILDNCEHLIEACAKLATALLRGCPNLRVLATSREGLKIAGELTHRVPPMVSDEAIQLFVERARIAREDFTLTTDNRPFIAEICQRLDGMPLALELAAARTRVLSVEQIAARLDDRFRLLTGGARDALPRQQTLRTTIDWSYDLLSPEERKLLQQLSAFAGGCTLEAVESVSGNPNAIDLLDQLSNKSLLTAVETPLGTRFNVLETIRQYAHDKLVEAGEFEVTQERHLQYYTALALRAEPHLDQPERRPWLDMLEADHDNIRAALGWAAHQEDRPAGVDLANALIVFWVSRGYIHEGIGWLQQLVVNRSDVNAPDWIKGAIGIGWQQVCIGEIPAAVRIASDVLPVAHESGDQRMAQFTWAFIAYHDQQRSRDENRAIINDYVNWIRANRDEKFLAGSLGMFGRFLIDRHYDPEPAIATLNEAMAIHKKYDDASGITDVLQRLADIEYQRGDYIAARALLE